MKTSRRNSSIKRRRFNFQPVPEPLEQRRVLSTFNVTTTTDSVPVNTMTGIDATGQVSLRSAIMAANADGGSNTINLPAGTYDLTLSGTDGDLAINGNLTIQGAGAATTIINGEQTTITNVADLNRVFEIQGGDVTISGVTVTGGASLMGGGILNNGGNLTLSGDTITKNEAVGFTGANGVAGTAGATGGAGAEGGTAEGGGVDNASGTLAIVNSVISDNSATGGTGGDGGAGGEVQGTEGAAAATSPNQMGGKGGSATGASGEIGGQGGVGAGGGVYNALGATLTLASTTFSSNTATGGAGGVGGVGGKAVGGTGGASQQLGGFFSGTPSDIGGTGGTGTGGIGGIGGQGGTGAGGGLYNAGTVTATDTQVGFTMNTAAGGAGGKGGTGGNGIGGLGGSTVTSNSVSVGSEIGGQGGTGVGGVGGVGGTGGQAEGGGLYDATGVQQGGTINADIITVGGGLQNETAARLTAPALSVTQNVSKGGTGGGGGTGGSGFGGGGADGFFTLAGNGGNALGGAAGLGGTGGAGLGGGVYNDTGATLSVTPPSGTSTPALSPFGENNATGGTGGVGGTSGPSVAGAGGIVPGEGTDQASGTPGVPGTAAAGLSGPGGVGGLGAGGALFNLGSASFLGAPVNFAANIAHGGIGGAGGTGIVIDFNGSNGGSGGDGGNAHGGGIDNGPGGVLTLAPEQGAASGSSEATATDVITQNQSLGGAGGAGGAGGTTGAHISGAPGSSGTAGSGFGSAATFDPAGTATLSNTTITPDNTVEGSYTGEVTSPTPTPTPTPPPIIIGPIPAPTPPHVTRIDQAGSSSKGLTALSVTFDEALNAVATSDLAFFEVLGGVKKHGKNVFTKGLKIKGTTYNPATHTVTLTLAKPYKGPVQVTVEAGVPSADGVPTSAGVTDVVA